MTHGTGFIGAGGLRGRGRLGDCVRASGRDVRLVGGADVSEFSIPEDRFYLFTAEDGATFRQATYWTGREQ